MLKIILSLIGIFSLPLYSQYEKTVAEDRQWNEYRLGQLGGSMSYYRFDGDTVYKSQTFSRMIETDSAGNYIKTLAMVLEDINTPSLTFHYLVAPGLYGDSLYLDLSLSVGDSSGKYSCSNSSQEYFYVLDSISTFTDHQSNNHKQYHFTAFDDMGSGYYFNWIEGIGSTIRGLNYFVPFYCTVIESFNTLLCVSDSANQKIYINPSENVCYKKVGLQEELFPGLEIYPNPVKDRIRFSGLQSEGVLEVKMTDLAGRELLIKEISPPCTMETGNIPPGTYVLWIKGRTGNFFSTKLVKN